MLPDFAAMRRSFRCASYVLASVALYSISSTVAALAQNVPRAAAAVADRRGSLGPQAGSRCGNVPDAVEAIACNIAGLVVFRPSVEGLTLISPLHHAIVAFHGGPVA